MLIKVIFISNIVLGPYLDILLKKIMLQHGLTIELVVIDFGEYALCKDKLYDADYVVVCLNFECLFPNVENDILSGHICREEIMNKSIETCDRMYSDLRGKCTGTILWFGFEDYYCQCTKMKGSISIDFMLVDEANLMLYKMIKSEDVYLDLKRMIADVGIKSVYNWRGKYRWNSPYTIKFIEKICEEIMKQCIIKGGMRKTKKCIVLDCDNVLWGGILAEDGIGGIQLGEEGCGRRYKEFQRILLYMYYHGIILTVCTKNSLDEILQVFREHDEMIITEEYIAYIEAGWGSKADSVLKIVERLGISADSMIFIDDSENEIKEVCSRIPGIEGVLFEDDNIYKAFSGFYLEDADSDMARERTLSYQMDGYKSQFSESADLSKDYIAQLHMEIDIHRVRDAELRRVSELTRRANRCTNGIRFSLQELKKKVKNSKYELYSMLVSDRYSCLGLVGVIGFENEVLDLFALSCRAFGRGLEEKMMDYIKGHGIQKFRFLSTGRNEQLYLFLVNKSGLTELL